MILNEDGQRGDDVHMVRLNLPRTALSCDVVCFRDYEAEEEFECLGYSEPNKFD